jgi:hypothetical protein
VQYFTIDKSILSNSSTYEVRVSYLGFDAAAFKMSWEPCNTKTSQRHLLDTEKIVFSTDKNKAIDGNPCENYVISVRAVRESKGISTSVENRVIHYNLAFERYGKNAPVPESIMVIVILLATFVPCSFLIYNTFMYTKRANDEADTKEEGSKEN